MSVAGRRDQQNVAYTHGRILFGLKEGGTLDTCYSEDVPGEQRADVGWWVQGAGRRGQREVVWGGGLQGGSQFGKTKFRRWMGMMAAQQCERTLLLLSCPLQNG